MRFFSAFVTALLSTILSTPAAAQSAYDIGMRQVKAQRFDEARISFSLACDAGSQEACAELAELYEKGRGGPTDRPAAERLSKAACDANVGKGCERLGTMRLFDENHVASEKLLIKGCDLDRGLACSNLGYIYEKGKLGTADVQKASALYDRACELDSAVGCNNVAVLLRDGLGGSRDEDRALQMFKTNCETRNYMNSCVHAGKLLITGAYSGRMKYFGKACDAGNAEGCYQLGRTYNNRIQHGETTAELERDLKLGNEYFAKACKMGWEVSCRSKAKILEKDKTRVAETEARLLSAAEAKRRLKAFKVENHGCDFSSYQIDKYSQASVDRSLRIQRENERCVKQYHSRQVERLNSLVAEYGGWVRLDDGYKMSWKRSCDCESELTDAVERIKAEDARLWAKIKNRVEAHNRIIRN